MIKYITKLKTTFFLLCLILAGCQISSNNNEPKVIKEIRDIKGSFVFNKNTNDYEYDKKEELERLFKSVSDKEELVQQLYSYLDNESLSNSYFNGKQLPIGNICYQALSQLIYYEPNDEHGDLNQNWKGNVEPYSNLEKLKEAKLLLKIIIEKKTYIYQ